MPVNYATLRSMNLERRITALEEGGMMWRHVKRGGLYEVVTHSAFMQCSTHEGCETFFEGVPWTVYRDVHHPEKVYFRLTTEFLDGRFEEVPA